MHAEHVAAARRGPRLRSVVLTVALCAAAVLVGVSGAGVTQALLTSTATQPGFTVKAGTLTVLIDGAASATLAPKPLSPAAPAAWAFRVTNNGDARAGLAAHIAAPTGPAYATSARALIAPVVGEGSCSAAVVGTTAALHGYANSDLGAVDAGQSQWYCLVVSLPSGTASTGTGSPLSFSLTIDATQRSN